MMESHLCPKCESGAYFSNSIPSGSLNIEGLNLNLLLMIIAIDSNSQIMQMAPPLPLPSSAFRSLLLVQSPAFKFRFVFFSFKSCVISAVCRPIWLKFDTRLTCP